MAPRAMKAAAMKKGAAAMSKSGIAAAIATATSQKPAVVKSVLDSLATVATKEVKKNGLLECAQGIVLTCGALG